MKAHHCEGPSNREGMVKVSPEEFGNGSSSRVYIHMHVGEMNGKQVAAKRLKAVRKDHWSQDNSQHSRCNEYVRQ